MDEAEVQIENGLLGTKLRCILLHTRGDRRDGDELKGYNGSYYMYHLGHFLSLDVQLDVQPTLASRGLKQAWQPRKNTT